MHAVWLLIATAAISILILWIKAYFLSVVWNCYKYVCHLAIERNASLHPYNNRVHGRRDIEMVHVETFAGMDESPTTSDAMLVLPPKYEDLLPAAVDVSAEPPAYNDVCVEKETE
jgi:hypothetical protein